MSAGEQNPKFNPFKTPRDSLGQPIVEDANIVNGLTSIKGDQFFSLL
jgi:hypothetical protein